MIINFKYNTKKDAEAWVTIAKSKDIYGMNYDYMTNFMPKDLLESIQEIEKKEAVKLVVSYLNENNQYFKYINLFKNVIQTLWTTKEKEYIEKLEKITKKSFNFEKITCYITTGNMCPYNFKNKWFTISIKHSLPHTVKTIAHELLHFQTHQYYNVSEDIKEALTFLLNEKEFDNILIVKDEGYPRHQEIRKELKKNWKKNKDFEKLLKIEIK